MGLGQHSSVSLQRRAPDMRWPVVSLGLKQPQLRLRPEIEAWTARKGR